MLMPSIFGEDLFDEFMDDFPFYDDKETKKLEKKLYGHRGRNLMKTDIREKDTCYELEMDLPGFAKDELQVSLKDGYLTITATTKTNDDQKDENGKYIRRERYYGTCSRSFYVGDDIEQEDIKAKFEDGILKIGIPKKEAKPEVEANNFITIEG